MPKEIQNDDIRSGVKAAWRPSSFEVRHSFVICHSSFVLRHLVSRSFFIIGPTAVGKSELTAEVAALVGGEVVSADAFQIYRGLDLLSAKPEATTLSKAPHHLIGVVPLTEEMNAEKFRTESIKRIAEIQARGRQPLVVGGSGLYVKALTHGLTTLPAADDKLRNELNRLGLTELCSRLLELDPKAAQTVDLKNRRRVVRALEICLLSGKPVSAQRTQWQAVVRDAEPRASQLSDKPANAGVFVFRNREDLYQRINERVKMIFKKGVVDEVRAAGPIGSTASQMIGLGEIRALLAGEISMSECISRIQQATRRYAKRQLTWFARQSNLEALNLSFLSYGQAVDGIRQRVSLLCPQG
jgi:tRNA dimethylallyltransferase